MRKRKNKTIFITGTDTHVGKTTATLVLGVLLKAKGYHVGVMKPVQCAGDDALFLKEKLELDDDMDLINPCYAPHALSPHLAFRLAQKRVSLDRIFRSYARLKEKYEILLVEGAGGLMVPLKNKYYNADLARDLNAEIIIVARLGLGTINHTLLTINQAKAYGLKIKGLIFCTRSSNHKTIAEQTNPTEISKLSGIPVLGVIPYLKYISTKEALKKCTHIAIN